MGVEKKHGYVWQLGSSTRLSNCLKNAGIETFDDLRKRTIRDMFKIKNFGRCCFDELIELLDDACPGESFFKELDYHIIDNSIIRYKKVQRLQMEMAVMCLIGDGKTLREIGNLFGLSRERVRQIYGRGVRETRRFILNKRVE